MPATAILGIVLVIIALVHLSQGFSAPYLVYPPIVRVSRRWSSTTVAESSSHILSITEKAMGRLSAMKTANELYLRVAVKSGGCSGMSYAMDIVDKTSIKDDDVVETIGEVKCVVDPKSLLYLYGLKLDYSDALVGGGFKFNNPNAETSCGCGKSFGV